jgi:hypothetical protein
MQDVMDDKSNIGTVQFVVAVLKHLCVIKK